jgi:nucleoside-diphosphate kinase
LQEIARALRPKSLRALFGSDKIKNAVHCTDLPEDAILEVNFEIILKSIKIFVILG